MVHLKDFHCFKKCKSVGKSLGSLLVFTAAWARCIWVIDIAAIVKLK